MKYVKIHVKPKVRNGLLTAGLPHYRKLEEISPSEWIIEIPKDEYFFESGKPNHLKIRKKYLGQEWDRDTLEQEIEEMIVK